MKKFPTCYLCCACKLIMHFVCAEYCRNNDIKKLLDGYNRRQSYYPEQVPAFHSTVAKTISKKYLIDIISPLYELLVKKGDADIMLRAFGLSPDYFDREKGGQAVCSLGGCFKPPRNLSGEVDKKAFGKFEKGSLAYTAQKISDLCRDSDILQNREDGPVRKPAYQHQIEAAAGSALIISTIGYN